MVAAHAYDLEAAKKMYGHALMKQAGHIGIKLTNQQWYEDCVRPTLD